MRPIRPGTLVIICLALLGTPLAGVETADGPVPKRYLDVAKRSLDAILEHARDTYGPVHSGMVLSLLDCGTAEPLTTLPKASAGIRDSDRTGPYGSNANLQQDLYRAWIQLSRLTGDRKYEAAATAALVDFLRITQNPNTGLLAWGEHIYWDCMTEGPGNKLIHEPKRKLAFFDLLYAAEPERTLRYAMGIWDHQIADKATGNFSRHAHWEAHSPGKDADFPKEGSYFIDIWARAYEKSHDAVYLTAIDVLAKRYLSRMNSLDLLNFDSTTAPERINTCIPLWMVSLAMESHAAAERVDGQAKQTLRELATRQDHGFLSLPHELAGQARGFAYCVATDSGAFKKWHGTDGHARAWSMGYGINLDMMFGLLCYSRQMQLGKTAEGDAYRRLVVQAADLYRSVAPEPAHEDIWAGEYGMAIFLELAAHRLTRDEAYLKQACALADRAITDLWGDGLLPRASTKTRHYEAITYPDTLILSLLALYEQLTVAQPQIEISDLNR